MASLANLPKLRRTLTDVMEDELYHIPGSNGRSNSSSPLLPHALLNHHQLQKNSSQEYLSIPDSMIQHHNLLLDTPALINDEDEEMFSGNEDDENLEDFYTSTTNDDRSDSVQPFNLYANPAIFNTFNNHHHHQNQQHQNHQSHQNHQTHHQQHQQQQQQQQNQHHNHHSQQHPQQYNLHHYAQQNFGFPIQHIDDPLTVSPRDAHLKLPEELMLGGAASNGLFSGQSDSHFYILPEESKVYLTPEELFNEELSEDEDEDDEDEDEDDLMDTDFGLQNDQSFSPPSTTINEDDDLYTTSTASKSAGGALRSSPLSFNVDDILPITPQSKDTHLGKGDNNNDIEQAQHHIKIEDDNSNQAPFTNNHVPLKNETLSLETPPNSSSSSSSSSVEVVPSKHEIDFEISSNEDSLNRQRRKSSMNTPKGNDGVHQCFLINPLTNKTCLKQFSRPYDLVRHQETIHAERKKIYKCTLCEDDYNKTKNIRAAKKTFSRGDALSRHIRVKHGLTGVEATDAIKKAKENVEYIEVN
ncbi:hypothetical protein PACTADRAFT_17612 [Pachysolen tannophilus NRRL Y-2460]|uniref:C2H2-type domain-containing protein n=1 Tax=Pachysolen tannophilus NRRL Y-2460 TaxID=669874 RepID=A0A1E4TT76_PACTA|nr:hypothetical protein PACTADRAFT_17612 [Pachysolen tannophilus NRRL Y-2460]